VVGRGEYSPGPVGEREFFVFSHKSSENNAYSVITL